MLVCSCFFISGFIWGKHRKPYRSESYAKENIRYFLDATTMIHFQTNEIISIDYIVANRRNILFFWTPDCSFCENFLDDFSKLRHDARLICFPIDIDADELDSYLSRNEIVDPQIFIYNAKNEIINPFGVELIPSILVVDNDGNIIYSQTGGELNERFISAIQ